MERAIASAWPRSSEAASGDGTGVSTKVTTGRPRRSARRRSGASPCGSPPGGACRSCAGCSPRPRRPSGGPRRRRARPPRRREAADERRVVAEEPVAVELDDVRRPSARAAPGCAAAARCGPSWTRAQTASRRRRPRGVGHGAACRQRTPRPRGSARTAPASCQRGTRPARWPWRPPVTRHSLEPSAARSCGSRRPGPPAAASGRARR